MENVANAFAYHVPATMALLHQLLTLLAKFWHYTEVFHFEPLSFSESPLSTSSKSLRCLGGIESF